jgi:hypothetical protein
MRKLCRYAVLVVLAHVVVVFWHLELLARRDAALKVDQVPLFAALANIIPLIALISLWAHFPKLGAWLLLFLAVPLAIGGYSHFLSPGSSPLMIVRRECIGRFTPVSIYRLVSWIFA